MAKITLDTLTAGYNIVSLNANFVAIENALNNDVLYRDNPGIEPNEMDQVLDMNNSAIINHAIKDNLDMAMSDVVSWANVQDLAGTSIDQTSTTLVDFNSPLGTATAIYSFDGNTLNHPQGNSNDPTYGIGQVWNYSRGAGTGVVQVAYINPSISSGTTRTYVRYYVAGSAWTAWDQNITESALTSLSIDKLSVVITDFNDLQTETTALYSYDEDTLNHPQGNSNDPTYGVGQVWHFSNGTGGAVQVAYSNASVSSGTTLTKTRAYTASVGWGAWESLAYKSDLVSLQSEIDYLNGKDINNLLVTLIDLNDLETFNYSTALYSYNASTLNHPQGGSNDPAFSSGQVWHYSLGTGGSIQVAYSNPSISSGTTRIRTRTYVQGGTWTSWESLATTADVDGLNKLDTLLSDFNDLQGDETALYSFDGDTLNHPQGNTNDPTYGLGQVWHYSAGNGATQVAYMNSSASSGTTRMYMRAYTASIGWTFWNIVTTADILANLDSDDIANASVAPGATVSDTLNSISAAIPSDTSDISNVSTVSGATTTDALNTLAGVDAANLVTANSYTDAQIAASIGNVNTTQLANCNDMYGVFGVQYQAFGGASLNHPQGNSNDPTYGVGFIEHVQYGTTSGAKQTAHFSPSTSAGTTTTRIRFYTGGVGWGTWKVVQVV